MASSQGRLGQRALAVLDVALRVPCIFIIDAIFNSYYEPGPSWASTAWSALFRVVGKSDRQQVARTHVRPVATSRRANVSQTRKSVTCQSPHSSRQVDSDGG